MVRDFQDKPEGHGTTTISKSDWAPMMCTEKDLALEEELKKRILLTGNAAGIMTADAGSRRVSIDMMVLRRK